ncbi:Oidioi.mRNA.OKI2018_I69.chr2.g6885.t3.cds [Oikopleura dioica]|uniref:Oidioi.mRNA.OKI2018_I69.chr2.g6885.t3.cds n=1 Tax=Oikopleura dioica TaxID=34765 RepID=A0ABN7TB84_OIKDI|nr:Oidioi.mRNA.OKI2018_I69.chr2.g6885.t3.cds [Oikopleura dioica]
MDSGKTKSPNLKSNENAKTKMEDSAKTKGHCRSKSQTYSFTGSVCDEIEKHFEQSLSLLDQKHQKSKSLPRAMKGSFPASFFEQKLKQHSSTDSLQNSSDSGSLGPMRVHRTHSSSKRNRNREIENKDSHKKGRQYKQLQSLIKSEPPSAQNHLKGVGSPGSAYSSSLGSPQHASNSLQGSHCTVGVHNAGKPPNAQATSINHSQHSRSRSLPIIPKRQPTQAMGRIQPLAVDIERIPLPGNWEMYRENSQMEDPRVQILEQFKRKHMELCEYNDGPLNDQISEITTDSSMTDDSINMHSSFDSSLSPKRPSHMTNMPVQSQNNCQFGSNGQSTGNGTMYYDSTTSMMSRLQMHQMSPSPQQAPSYDHNQNSNPTFSNSPHNQQHIDSQVQDYMMDMGLDPNRYSHFQSNSSQSLPQSLRRGIQMKQFPQRPIYPHQRSHSHHLLPDRLHQPVPRSHSNISMAEQRHYQNPGDQHDILQSQHFQGMEQSSNNNSSGFADNDPLSQIELDIGTFGTDLPKDILQKALFPDRVVRS